MRVLVTGASGMLGRAVAEHLAARGDQVTVLQRRPSGSPLREVLGDVADPVAAAEAAQGQDAVIHLAAKVDVVGPWADYERTNLTGTRTLVEAARTAGATRFDFQPNSDHCFVYSDPAGHPFCLSTWDGVQIDGDTDGT